MKRHIPILLVCLTVVLLIVSCNGADEVTGPQIPELRPKKAPAQPDRLVPRAQPVVVERPRAPVVAPARESLPPPDPTRTPRVRPCWKDPENCLGD